MWWHQVLFDEREILSTQLNRCRGVLYSGFSVAKLKHHFCKIIVPGRDIYAKVNKLCGKSWWLDIQT
ncbi:MAG: hypothetical protein ACJAXW_002834 [Candidatus Azotimanducaceae bacterium]|jgi:hypothetical protein